MSSPILNTNKLQCEDEDSPSDFYNVQCNSKSLHRPTDHYSSYMPPPRRKGHLASRFLKDPLNTALSQFVKVTNYVFSPLEDYDTSAFDLWSAFRHSHTKCANKEKQFFEEAVVLPPPALPLIECSNPQNRLSPLTEKEFELMYLESDIKAIFLRIFRGGIANNSLRQKLWPLIIGLTDNLEPINWSSLERLYKLHKYQWVSILPAQELRFTAYRERKSIAERDVIRCDRYHAFYQDSTGNISKLRELLMTYIMYDFDTGYIQGMSDLAGPLLYIWSGDVVKSFWCFVHVMNLYRRNFELSQNSISIQLKTLMKLIEMTDPVFAQYLTANDSDNCYFAFRWIICIFKREFMKAKTDDYDDCLIVWETIWALQALCLIEEKEKKIKDKKEKKEDLSKEKTLETGNDEVKDNEKEVKVFDSASIEKSPVKLQTVELFSLCICLSIIRAERDIILANRFEANDILKHFNTVRLNESLNTILVNAMNVWYWLKYDGGEKLLYNEDKSYNKSDDDYDFLSDEEYLFQNALNV